MEAAILIVEDDTALRMGMRLLLRKHGHPSVAVAGTLAEARRQIDSAVPSHMILDLNLSDGLGTDLLRHMRTNGMQTHVTVLTGSVDSSFAAEADRLGVDAVICKPPDWDKLMEWANPEPAV